MTRGKQTKRKAKLPATVAQLSAGIAHVGEKGSAPAPAKKKQQMQRGPNAGPAECIACKKVLAKASFNNNEWKKGRKKNWGKFRHPTCKSCFGAGVLRPTISEAKAAWAAAGLGRVDDASGDDIGDGVGDLADVGDAAGAAAGGAPAAVPMEGVVAGVGASGDDDAEAGRVLATAAGVREHTIGPREVPDNEVQGHIFDIDGTLIDSMAGFFLSWKIATAAHGLSITEEFFYRSAGRTLPDMVSALHQSTHGTPATAGFVAAFLDTKIAANKQYELKHGHPDEITTVVSIALAAQAKGIPIACATSGLRETVLEHLRAAGIEEIFQTVICSAEVPHGKPAPDVFEEACRQIGADPKKCRAYEDGEAGMQAAWAAGMQVVDVRGMKGYPITAALRTVIDEVRADPSKRPWLQ